MAKLCGLCGNNLSSDMVMGIPLCTHCIQIRKKAIRGDSEAINIAKSLPLYESVSNIFTFDSKLSASQVYPENFVNLGASSLSTASGYNLPYVVLQVTLKEKFIGTGSGNLEELEQVINSQVAKGYRLHTMSTSNGGSKGLAGGDRIQATLVFERLDMLQK